MKKTITLDTPIRFYAQISRVDPAERIVEGYCYVNPTVRGDKWDLSRAAMEEAGAEYEKAPAIRAMHQPIAAGVGLGLVWDDKGCLIRAHITDDKEWHKVETGTYRGFSIGGKPRIVRGNTVTKFDWVETSLVDRPCDPDALFTMARAESAEGEYQVEVDDTAEGTEEGAGGEPEVPGTTEGDSRAEETEAENPEDEAPDAERVAKVDVSGTAYIPTFADMVGSIKERASYSTIQAACYALSDVLSMALDNATRKQSVNEFSSFLNNYLDEADAEAARAESVDFRALLEAPAVDAAELARMSEVAGEHDGLVQRLETAESELSTARVDLESARGELSTAKEEVERLRKIEVNRKPPVEFPAAALNRNFQHNDEASERRTELSRERGDILERAKKPELTDAERNQMAARIASIDIELRRLN